MYNYVIGITMFSKLGEGGYKKEKLLNTVKQVFQQPTLFLGSKIVTCHPSEGKKSHYV